LPGTEVGLDREVCHQEDNYNVLVGSNLRGRMAAFFFAAIYRFGFFDFKNSGVEELKVIEASVVP